MTDKQFKSSPAGLLFFVKTFFSCEQYSKEIWVYLLYLYQVYSPIRVYKLHRYGTTGFYLSKHLYLCLWRALQSLSHFNEYGKFIDRSIPPRSCSSEPEVPDSLGTESLDRWRCCVFRYSLFYNEVCEISSMKVPRYKRAISTNSIIVVLLFWCRKRFSSEFSFRCDHRAILHIFFISLNSVNFGLFCFTI